MSDIKINSFNPCQQCGECCKTPCDLIPSDLPPLLEKFKMDLPDFFKKYLIALIVASPKYADEILMMVPTRVGTTGGRPEKFLADTEYLQSKGQCIFLENNRCGIHELKPFGGRFLQCAKITGSVSIQLSKNQYFAYWVNNQHLFELIFPGFEVISSELNTIFKRKNDIFTNQGKTLEYDRLHQEQVTIIAEKLFPLFNNKNPIKGFSVLYN